MLSSPLQQSVGSVRRTSMSTLVIRSTALSISRPGLAPTQARTFCWRRGCDYSSKIDPMFHRFTRFRTLKTRAKLIEKIRRQCRWDCDGSQHSLSTATQQRSASHVGRPKWYPHKEDESPQGREREASEKDDFELSEREKQWKDQMEAMRQRIEQDPYEAVFGKRFEPFWGPLVPSWMRDEIGLKNSLASSEANRVEAKQESAFYPKQNSGVKTEKAAYKPLEPETKKIDAKIITPESQSTGHPYKKNPQETEDIDGETPNGQVSTYSYGSTSSWDSWTKKARRVEWDSTSGEKRRFEYDPISNRMVQVYPVESEVMLVESVLKDKPRRPESPLVSNVWETGLGEKVSSSTSPVEVPVKTSSEARKAIPVPTETSDHKKNASVYFPSLINTSVVAKYPKIEKYPDALTAADVRASVGQARRGRVMTGETSDESRAYRFGKADPQKSQWDQAEQRVILNHELYDVTKKRQQLIEQEPGAFHIEKIKQVMSKLDARAAQLHKELDTLDALQTSHVPRLSIVRSAHSVRPNGPVMTSLTFDAPQTVDRRQKSSSGPLQPAVDRMQSKKLIPAEEPDDSAAHESTGEFGEYKVNLPNDWEKQTDLLQTDRIRRTRGPHDGAAQPVDSDLLRQSGTRMAETLREKRSVEDRVRSELIGKRNMSPRLSDMIHSLKAANDEKSTEAKASKDASNDEKNAKLVKANAMLQTEIRQQKFRMDAHENHHGEEVHVLDRSQTSFREVNEGQNHQRKIKDLRRELDDTFERASMNSEMQVDRIREPERELEEARKSSSGIVAAVKDKYVQKIKALRGELDTAFKQSSFNAEMQVDRIRELEKKLERASRLEKPIETVQAEGDMNPSAMVFAKDSSRWYKQETSPNLKDFTKLREELKAGEKNAREQDLADESKGIYEKQYGTIEFDHRQAAGQPHACKPDPSLSHARRNEPDHNLNEALSEYEQGRSYSIKADKLDLDNDTHSARTLEGSRPALILAGSTCGQHKESPNTAAGDSMQWEDPPVYKVLAYDSGNDAFTTAITSSKFSSREAPIAIQDALSQLYQPARFVPHFAELQKDGFQVIHGTKDLLLFKKVKQPEDSTAAPTPTLQDHGLMKPVAGLPTRNPIDGTSYSNPATGNFASPTGFVGDRWDNLFASDGIAQSPTVVSRRSDPGLTCALNEYEDEKKVDYDFKHFPRVKRQEHVFSGQRANMNGKRLRRRHHEPLQAEVQDIKQKWKSWRRRFRIALFTGITASVVAYGVGAATEKKKETELERWERVLKIADAKNGKGASWNINEGRWNN